MKKFIIREFDCLIRNQNIDSYISLPSKTFDLLEEFLLENKGKNEIIDIMNIRYKKNIGKCIYAKNYVGVLMLKDGTQIEILPKIYNVDNLSETKKIFYKMIKLVYNVSYKKFDYAFLETNHMNVFEIFIEMFCMELFELTKSGISRGYNDKIANISMVKGKILLSDSIKKNNCLKHKTLQEFNEYSDNLPENRIIKSALITLLKKTKSYKNKRNIVILLDKFQNLDKSENLKEDIDKVNLNRKNEKYRIILKWAIVFLSDESFTSFGGKTMAYSLLFPMDKLFEKYIGLLIRKRVDNNEFKVSLQDDRYYLFNKPPSFKLKPDIVIEDKNEDNIYILDTKWKIIEKNKFRLKLDEKDMYQMYIYAKKYSADSVGLIFPKHSPNMNDFLYYSDDDVFIKVFFINLSEIDNEIMRIINKVCI